MTPLIKFEDVFLKREDQNPTGSAKDRAVSLQVDHLKSLGFSSAAISSTGNAALSAIFYCQKNSVDLTVFVSDHINPQKLKQVRSQNNKVIVSPQPISDAFKFSKSNHSYFLRQSTDPVAQIGYGIIAKEILNQLPLTSSLFVPVGSGTTLLGISKILPATIKLFAVQPASHCPIASVLDSNYLPETTTITDALTAKYLPLKQQVIAAIKSSGGSGLVVQNQDVIKAQNLLLSNSITTSPESALALAGFLKAKKDTSYEIGDYPVILLTGAAR